MGKVKSQALDAALAKQGIAIVDTLPTTFDPTTLDGDVWAAAFAAQIKELSPDVGEIIAGQIALAGAIFFGAAIKAGTDAAALVELPTYGESMSILIGEDISYSITGANLRSYYEGGKAAGVDELSGLPPLDMFGGLFPNMTYKLTGDKARELVSEAKSLGRSEYLAAGLNDKEGGEPVVDIPEDVNAVELEINPDGRGWLNIDGRCRARFHGANRVVLINPGGGRQIVLKREDAPNGAGSVMAGDPPASVTAGGGGGSGGAASDSGGGGTYSSD